MDARYTSILLLLMVLKTESDAQYAKQLYHRVSAEKALDLIEQNADYGYYKWDVSQSDCEGACRFVKKQTTECSAVTPTRYGIQFGSGQIYYTMWLANCGNNVYVKVIGEDQFVVYYKKS